jgi:hypothetical protein
VKREEVVMTATVENDAANLAAWDWSVVSKLNNPLQGLMIAPRGTGAVKTVELSTVLSSSD